LFHQAIIMSDPMHIVLSTHDEALALGERFVCFIQFIHLII